MDLYCPDHFLGSVSVVLLLLAGMHSNGRKEGTPTASWSRARIGEVQRGFIP